MMVADIPPLDTLHLQRLDPENPARAAVFSLPVPPEAGQVTVPGLPSGGQPIAWWNPRMLERFGWQTGAAECHPRRLLMTVAGEQSLPESLPLQGGGAPQLEWRGPSWSLEVVESYKRGCTFWEVNELVLRHGSQETALRLGLEQQTGGCLWWEWLRVEELWQTPACKAIRCGGYIPAREMKTPLHPDCADKEARHAFWRGMKTSDALHHDPWLRGEAYILLFANGVIHLTTRFVNTHLYNRWGEDFEGILPVIAVRGRLSQPRTLDGTPVELDLGSVRLNTEECATFASPETPGRLAPEGEMVVLRPFDRISVPLDSIAGKVETGRDFEDDIGDPTRWLFPNGIARSVRFCLSLSDAPARVARYTVPDWWYGLLAELTPDSLLPVTDGLDSAIASGGRFLVHKQRTGCFDEGAVFRYHSRNESAWEGETAYNLFRWFYRQPSPLVWQRALSCVYNLADIAVHHVDFIMRMHGYDTHAISPTMNRGNGLLQGYLETGDPYLRETCEALAMAAFSLDTANWPRRAVGRDILYVRGLILLDDYLPGHGHGMRAREALNRLAQSLAADGAVTQQSGTVGFHASASESVGPWQCFHVLEPVMDWLERHPDDETLRGFFKIVCDWLVDHFVPAGAGGHWHSQTRDGDNEQHPINGQTFPFGTFTFPMYGARSLLLSSRLFDDPKYLECWERCLIWLREKGHLPAPGQTEHTMGGDHAANKSVESLSWHQLHRWRARWLGGELVLDPYHPSEPATILTPDGPRQVGVQTEAPA